MKKRILIIITIIILLCATIIISSKIIKNKKDNNNNEFTYTPLMYQICDSNSCIYLLGSIHLGDNRIDKFSNKIIEAYDKSDALAVELNINDISININEFILESGTIDEYITSQLSDKLNNFSNDHSLFPYETLKYMKIGYIYDYISLLPYLENGYNNEGVDSYFINLATKDNKKIISLESYEEQLKLLTGYSNEFYAKQIEDTIDNYDEVKDQSIKIYDAYLKGSEEELNKLIENDKSGITTEEEKDYIKKIYDERNIKMSEQVEEFLSNNEKVFMTVGCAHIIGNNGIIETLKNKYKISIIK